MLQSIRDRTQGWIAGIIISLLILSFALWGIHSYFAGGSASTTVAKVNGVEITKGQLAVAYERLRRQMQSQFGSSNELPGNLDAGLKDRALRALVNIQVLKQASIKQDYYIGSGQVDDFLEDMPEFQVDGTFSSERFHQALATTMYTPSEFLDLIKTSLLIDQPRLGMIFSSFALPNEMNEMISLIDQERDIRYVMIPYQNFSSQSMTISESEVQAYYEKHQDEFKTPEQVSVEYIELSSKNLVDQVQVTEDDLKNFYNDNTNTFAQPAQWKLDTILVPVSAGANEAEFSQASEKANEIMNKAKEGADFLSLSKLYSLKYSADTKKWIAQNQVATDLQKALLTITKADQVAGPIQVNDGFIIIKSLDFKEPQLMSFDAVKDKVKAAYLQQKTEEKFADLREKLANIAYEHPESLQSAAQELGLQIQTSELFSREKGGNDISSLSKVREAAFSNDVLNLQNNSDVIQKNSDTAVVVHLKSHLPSSLLSLNAVKPQIIEKLKTSAVNAKALQLANEIKNNLSAGKNIDSALKANQLSWNLVGFTSRHATTVDSALLDTAFAMPSPASGKMTFEVAKLPNGYAVVGLSAVKPGVSKPDETDVYSEQIQNSQGLLEYELYKQHFLDDAKIVS